MRPWQHARSSAGRNGDWLADLPIHEFIDATKLACPELRHRMILHNADLGAELAALAFPDRADAREIALRHVVEDVGSLPTLADWLAECDHSALPQPLYRRLPLDPEEMTARIARSQGLRDDSGTRAVLDLLLLPSAFAGPAALPVLFNGFGPALVRRVIGPPRLLAGLHGGQAMFDPAHIAEAMIYWAFGTIPPLPAVAAALRKMPGSARPAA